MSKQQINDLLNSGPFNRAGQQAQSLLLNQFSNNKGLGGALIVPITAVVQNKTQVRRVFDPESLAELAQDIKARGILEPLLVRVVGQQEGQGGKYEIVAGERRYRAALLAGLVELPVLAKDMSDQEAELVMLVENVQREDLDPSDEKRFFEYLQTSYNYSATDIGKLINKSEAYVRRRLKAQLESMQLPLPENSSPSGSDTNQPLPNLNSYSSDSEKNNDFVGASKLIKKSQSSKSFTPLRSVAKFSTFLEEARLRVSELDQLRKAELAAQVHNLREQLATLEYELNNLASDSKIDE